MKTQTNKTKIGPQLPVTKTQLTHNINLLITARNQAESRGDTRTVTECEAGIQERLERIKAL